MVMQGFFDDSGSSQHQRVFVLAGLVSWSNNWAEFADEWDAELQARPAISHFKWNDAAILAREFEGWKTEDMQAKRLRLAEIAKKYAMVRVQTRISWDEFKVHRDRASQNWPQSERLPPILDNPYFLLFFNVVLCMAQYRRKWRWDMGMEYYFDEQSRFGDDAMRYWNIAVQMMPEPLKPYAGQKPTHLSDRRFVPLQAADMYAGMCRTLLLNPTAPVEEVAGVFGQVPGIGRVLDAEIVKSAADDIANNPRLRKAIKALEP